MTIAQSTIPNRSETNTFGASIVTGGPNDMYIAVSDSAEGKLFLFNRTSTSENNWVYQSTLDIGVGNGNRMAMTYLKYVSIQFTTCSSPN